VKELAPNSRARSLIQQGQAARRAGKERTENPFSRLPGQKMQVFAAWWSKGWDEPERDDDGFFNDPVPF